MAKYGIDVCEYQGNIDWKKVKQAGCKFAVLKCIKKRLNLDSKFVANVKGCKENGIPIGVYTYVYEQSVSGAEARAKAAVTACKDQGLKGCIIWWDVEDPAVRKTGAANRAKLTASIKAARAIITAAGFGFGVYCDADFYTSCINANDLGGRYWIAAYHGNPVTTLGQAPKYKPPVIANELCGWQFCSKGRVSGISGSVDLNIAYDNDFTSFSKTEEKSEKVSKTSNPSNPYPAPTTTVCSGATAAKLKLQKWIEMGNMVKAVQWELCRLGYEIGKVDGICGSKTDAAIRAFQSGIGLTADGAVGSKTWPELVKATKKPAAPKESKSQATTTSTEKPKETTINYRQRVAEKAKEVYPLSVGKVHSGANVGKVVDLASLKKYKALSCNRMASITMQEAGLLPKGVIVSHTPKRSGKKTIDDAVKNWRKLKHCKVVWVNKLYKDLPEEYKKAGCVYYQNSNACISAGNGKIWSCNGSKGHRYKKGDYLKTSGYPFTSHILVVVIPDA